MDHLDPENPNRDDYYMEDPDVNSAYEDASEITRLAARVAEQDAEIAALREARQCPKCGRDEVEAQWVCEHCGHRVAIDEARKL